MDKKLRNLTQRIEQTLATLSDQEELTDDHQGFVRGKLSIYIFNTK